MVVTTTQLNSFGNFKLGVIKYYTLIWKKECFQKYLDKMDRFFALLECISFSLCPNQHKRRKRNG